MNKHAYNNFFKLISMRKHSIEDCLNYIQDKGNVMSNSFDMKLAYTKAFLMAQENPTEEMFMEVAMSFINLNDFKESLSQDKDLKKKYYDAFTGIGLFMKL
jgi:hypothetical protein